MLLQLCINFVGNNALDAFRYSRRFDTYTCVGTSEVVSLRDRQLQRLLMPSLASVVIFFLIPVLVALPQQVFVQRKPKTMLLGGSSSDVLSGLLIKRARISLRLQRRSHILEGIGLQAG